MFLRMCFWAGHGWGWGIATRYTFICIYTAWRKAVRKLLNLPWNTHSAYLPHILNQSSAKISIEKRICRYIFNGVNSPNLLVSDVFRQGIIERKGFIGDNVKYLMDKYGIKEQAFISNLNEMFHKIDQCNMPSIEIQHGSMSNTGGESLHCRFIVFICVVYHTSRVTVINQTEW